MSYEVHCSSCQGHLFIPDELWERRFAGRVQSLKCKKCGDRIRVDARPEPPLLDVANAPRAAQSEGPPAPSPATRSEVSVVFRLPSLPPPALDGSPFDQLVPAVPDAIVENAELFDDDEPAAVNRDELPAMNGDEVPEVSSARADTTPDASADSQPGAALDGATTLVAPRPSAARKVGLVAAALVVIAGLAVWLRPDPEATKASAAGATREPRSAAAEVETAKAQRASAGVSATVGASSGSVSVDDPSKARVEPEPATERVAADQAAADQAADDGTEPLVLGAADGNLEQQVDRLVEEMMKCHITGRAIGTATMRITIAPSGKVSHVSVVGDSIERQPVATCVKVRGLGTRFAPFGGQDSVVLSRELVFGDIPRQSKSLQ